MFKPKSFKKHQLHFFPRLYFSLFFYKYHNTDSMAGVLPRWWSCDCHIPNHQVFLQNCHILAHEKKGELTPLSVIATLHTVTNPFPPRCHPLLPLHVWWASPFYSFPEPSQETFFFIPCSIPDGTKPWSYNLASNEQIRAGMYVLRALIRNRGDRWECGRIKVMWSLGGNCSGSEVGIGSATAGR